LQNSELQASKEEDIGFESVRNMNDSSICQLIQNDVDSLVAEDKGQN